jgi:hypothetical protein
MPTYLNGFLKVIYGPFDLAQEIESLAEIMVGRGVIRIDFNQLLKYFKRIRISSFLQDMEPSLE